MVGNRRPIDQIIRDDYGGDADALLRDLTEYTRLRNNEIFAQKQSRDFSQQPLMIEVRDVAHTYKISRKNKIDAVRSANFSVHRGEIVALMGPSGSGKSTMMNLIGGLDKPSAGEIVVDGKDLAKISSGKLAKFRNETVGFVFQFFYLQPFLTTRRNVEVPLMFARTKRKTRREKLDEVIAAVGLTDRAKHFPKELSGGQMQRVAIARAVVNNPHVLIADEPTGNLDSKTGASIMDLFDAIREKFQTTILIVTHDPLIAARADRVIRCLDGEISQDLMTENQAQRTYEKLEFINTLTEIAQRPTKIEVKS